MIKAVLPTMLGNVVDRAIQVLGAMGLTSDTPLADLWNGSRALRIADGPDEVHLRSITRQQQQLPDAAVESATLNRNGAAGYPSREVMPRRACWVKVGATRYTGAHYAYPSRRPGAGEHG